MAQIQNVGGAGAVGVRHSDAPLVEEIGRVEPGRTIHGDLRAEASVAEVRPVADLAVADAHDVGQAVAGHVGEIDRLRAVGEKRPRTRLLLVERNVHAHRRAEAFVEQGWMPLEGVVLGDQNVGDAVAGHVDEAQIWVAPVQNRQRTERAETSPSAVGVALVEAGGGRRNRRDRGRRRRRDPSD